MGTTIKNQNDGEDALAGIAAQMADAVARRCYQNNALFGEAIARAKLGVLTVSIAIRPAKPRKGKAKK